MIQEEYVTFEQAKALKELGFPTTETIHYASIGQPIRETDNGLCYNNGTCIKKPTLSLVQKWLREEKNICLYVTPSRIKTDFPYIWNYTHDWNLEDENDIVPFNSSMEWFETYEQALLAGINECIKLLKEL